MSLHQRQQNNEFSKTNNTQFLRFEENCISKIFFSEENAKNLMKIIRLRVFRLTDKVIDEQSYNELQIIMNSYYFNAELNEEGDVKAQLKKLNAEIINYCTTEIVENLELTSKISEEIFNNPTNLMDRPNNESIKGSRTGNRGYIDI